MGGDEQGIESLSPRVMSDHSGTAGQICWQTAQLTRQTITHLRLTVAFKNIYAESLGVIAAQIL